MTELADKVVVLTGAGSGIGRALAQALVAVGARVEMADKNEDGLMETAGLIGDGDAVARVLDVANLDEWEAWSADIHARRGAPDIVINNAGVTLAALGKDMTYDDLEWVMSINFWGVVYGTRTFLPAMVERDSGHVVNVSSVFGLFGVRSQSAYCTSKFAVRGYSDSLRVELDGTGVEMSVVHPGGIQTNIVRNIRYRLQGEDSPSRDQMIAGFDEATPTTPAGAADTIIAGIRKNKARILIGNDAKYIDIMSRLIPASFPLRMGRRNSGVTAAANN